MLPYKPPTVVTQLGHTPPSSDGTYVLCDGNGRVLLEVANESTLHNPPGGLPKIVITDVDTLTDGLTQENLGSSDIVMVGSYSDSETKSQPPPNRSSLVSLSAPSLVSSTSETPESLGCVFPQTSTPNHLPTITTRHSLSTEQYPRQLVRHPPPFEEVEEPEPSSRFPKTAIWSFCKKFVLLVVARARRAVPKDIVRRNLFRTETWRRKSKGDPTFLQPSAPSFLEPETTSGLHIPNPSVSPASSIFTHTLSPSISTPLPRVIQLPTSSPGSSPGWGTSTILQDDSDDRHDDWEDSSNSSTQSEETWDSSESVGPISRNLQAIFPDLDLKGIDISDDVSLSSPTRIARGGFCEIYLGHHRKYGKVALRRPKSTPQEELVLKRFLREITLWCKVSHINILPLFGVCTIGQSFYMVTPFIKNGNLMDCIKNGFDLDRTKILSEIADAVAYLHRQGIVHGDIKAQNVLLSDSKSPLLCDFGLAKALDSMVTSTDAKGRGSIRWMAPELLCNGPKTKESDVYAFGMTIAEVLTGAPPLAHIHSYAVTAQVLYYDARPQRPTAFESDSHSDCWEVAERCWVKEGSKRLTMDVVLLGIWSNRKIPGNLWSRCNAVCGDISYSTGGSSLGPRSTQLSGATVLDGNGYGD